MKRYKSLINIFLIISLYFNGALAGSVESDIYKHRYESPEALKLYRTLGDLAIKKKNVKLSERFLARFCAGLSGGIFDLIKKMKKESTLSWAQLYEQVRCDYEFPVSGGGRTNFHYLYLTLL